MWFYNFGGKKYGSVDIKKLKELQSMGVINGKTPVLKEGETAWHYLQETDLPELIAHWVPAPANFASESDLTAMADPESSSQAKPVRKRKTARILALELMNSFSFWVPCQILYILCLFFQQYFPKLFPHLIFSLIFGFASLTAFIYKLVLLFRFWKIVQDGHARISPKAAAWLMLLPIFNLYWNFVAYYGLSKDFNRYIEKHFTGNKTIRLRYSTPITSLVYSLFRVISLLGIYCLNFIDFFTSRPAAKLAFKTYNQIAVSNNKYSIALFILAEVFLIVIYFDFYLTARSILKAEGLPKKVAPEISTQETLPPAATP
jgi:hypothetical protein